MASRDDSPAQNMASRALPAALLLLLPSSVRAADSLSGGIFNPTVITVVFVVAISVGVLFAGCVVYATQENWRPAREHHHHHHRHHHEHGRRTSQTGGGHRRASVQGGAANGHQHAAPPAQAEGHPVAVAPSPKAASPGDAAYHHQPAHRAGSVEDPQDVTNHGDGSAVGIHAARRPPAATATAGYMVPVSYAAVAPITSPNSAAAAQAAMMYSPIVGAGHGAEGTPVMMAAQQQAMMAAQQQAMAAVMMQRMQYAAVLQQQQMMAAHAAHQAAARGGVPSAGRSPSPSTMGGPGGAQQYAAPQARRESPPPEQ